MLNTPKSKHLEPKSPTGVPGLDEVLRGGLPSNQLYLIQGKPGTGKTTLALMFLIEGAARKEKVLYVTFSETKQELEAVAHSHGWDLSHVEILELSAINLSMGESRKNTLFHNSEIELEQTINLLLERIKTVNPQRIVFDSVSELRLLSDSSLKYRRQMLSFKEFFINRGSTVLFLDDMSTEAGDMHVQSIVHGVLLLEKIRAGYGVERRQFHIAKLRGVNFRAGTHDYIIARGGVQIFPRLVSGEYKKAFDDETISTGVPELDKLLGGGLDCGTSNLLLGPAGTGKSTIAIQCAYAAAQQGKKAAVFSFEEAGHNLIARAKALNIDIQKYIDSGHILLRKIDPAEMTPGQFTSLLRGTNSVNKTDMVIIDSLNGYIHAMPEQQFLILQLHELLSYLSNKGVITIMVLAQAGIMGTMQTPLDLTYIADSVILTRYFEAFGSMKKAISVTKKRTGFHEPTLREFKFDPSGIKVGKVLSEFRGIFTGTPHFLGDYSEIMDDHELEPEGTAVE
ncbi:MAG: AAA family ATPase [Bdellovibrionales bacterium]|nr:AAA family ATPase [Bdellovibrionales bacterium]